MDKVFSVVLPLFAMILCGFTIVRAGVVGRETVKGLVSAVFWLFLPCFIFMKTLGARDQGSLDWALLGAYYSACLVVFMLAVVGGRLLFGEGLRIACLRGLSSISGVVGYMGLPLMAMAFDSKAILPALMITMADNLVILAGGALMMEMTTDHSSNKPQMRELLMTTGKGIIINPLILSVLLALVFIAANLQLPSPVKIFATQMTNATGPLALVALGAALATHSEKGFSKADAVLLAVLKTVILPILVFCSSKYVFGLDDYTVKIAVLMATLPIAVNVFILASRYKTYEIVVSNAMMLSAMLGVVVISFLMVVLT